MKYKSIIFIILLSYLFPIFLVVLFEYSYIFEDLQLNPFDYARITEVEYKAKVVDEPGGQGKVVITERLTFDIHAASKNNLFWELWRDLPEDYVDGVKVDYQVNSVKQILDDGTKIIYEESPKLYWDDNDYISSRYGPGKWYHSEGPYDPNDAQYECVFFYVDGLYREKVVFEIEYEMRNAALRYNDCSDLYLALYSGSTCKYLESFKAQILFPNKDMPSPGNYEVYTYGTNANEFPIRESATLNRGYHTFLFELDEKDLKFRPYNQYIEFDLVSYNEDRHIFTEYAPDNDYSYDDVLDEIYDEQQEYASAPQKYKIAKIIVLFLCLVISFFVFIYVSTTVKGEKAKHAFYKPAMEMKYFRDIPSDLDPNFAAALVFCKHKPKKLDSGVYSAILLSLARKNYINITEGPTNNILISIKNPQSGQEEQPGMTIFETREPLTLCEEYYFNLLIRHANNNCIYMDSLQKRVAADYENTDSFLKNMENSIVNIGVKERFFQKADYDQPRKSMQSKSKFLRNTGLFFLILVNIISYQTRLDLAFGGFSILGLCCISGATYLKAHSKKMILLTQHGEDEYAKWRGLYNFLNSETLMHERTLIELPIWERYLVYATAFGLSEKIIKAISIRCPEASQSPVLNNSCYRSPSFHSSGRSFHSSVRSGSSVARSGGGGGFGYGGGGRGGGGGGGGH